MADPELKQHARNIQRRLTRAIPEPRCELDHADAWQLLVATILSAQSTDKGVNTVTPRLFAAYPTPAALGAARLADVEKIIKPTGFFRNKARAIVGASRKVAEEHGGVVPRRLDRLIELPGVARKTANVVLGTAYRISSGVTVDTHAGRVARRLELTAEEDPVEVERDLCDAFARRSWIDMGHRLVLHGRYVCKSQRPRCDACPLHELCSESQVAPVGRWTARADAERATVESRGRTPLPDAPPAPDPRPRGGR